jgi:integrase
MSTDGVPRGTVWKYCSCRDPSGRGYTGDTGENACPRSKDRRHGVAIFAIRVGGRLLKRSGFATKGEAEAALERVRSLLKLAGDDVDVRQKIFNIIAEKSGRRGPLPDEDELARRVGAGIDVDRPVPTVGEWLVSYYSNRRDLRPSTKHGALRCVETRLVPYLGELPLDKLRRKHVRQLFAFIESRNDLVRAGGRVPDDDRDGRGSYNVTGVATQHRIYATLRSALNAAVEDELIPANPCGRKPPLAPEERDPRRAWSPEVAGRFLDYVDGRNERLAPLFRVVLLRGLRRGEAVGLRWSDVDLDAATLQVAQTIVRVGGELVYGAPKSRASRRIVTLDPGTVEALREHQRRQFKERDAARGAYEDRNLVFAREDGTPTPPEDVSRRFRELTREAGLPAIRFHDLRHTAATLARMATRRPTSHRTCTSTCSWSSTTTRRRRSWSCCRGAAATPRRPPDDQVFRRCSEHVLDAPSGVKRRAWIRRVLPAR